MAARLAPRPGPPVPAESGTVSPPPIRMAFRWSRVVASALCVCALLAVWGAPEEGDVALCSEILGTTPSMLRLLPVQQQGPVRSDTARCYEFRLLDRDNRPGAWGTIALETQSGRLVWASFATRPPSTPRGRASVDIASTESLACGFARALLGGWHQMDLTARMALPPENPVRYVFLWVQRDEHGHRTGTQAGVSVWADGRGIRSGVGRVAPAHVSAVRVSDDEATSAALEYVREFGIEVTAIRAELVLSWLQAREQGPVWLVHVTSQPEGSSSRDTVGREQVCVVDAVAGAVLGWTGGAWGGDP